MSLFSLIQNSINNPPVDGDTSSTEGGIPASPALQAREEAFIKLADTSVEDDPVSPGARFGIGTINSSNAAALQKRLSNEAVDLRRQEAAEIEQQLMDSDLSPEATFGTIKELREQIQLGVAPEDLAVQELSAYNVGAAARRNDDDIAMVQAIEDQEKYSVRGMLQTMRNEVEYDKSSVIPGLGAAYDMISSGILFPISGGTNVAGLLEATFGQDIPWWEHLAPGNRVVEAQKIAAAMDGPQSAAAIKRAHKFITENAGVIFDNKEDAMIMLNAVESAFGTRVQAEASRVAGTTGQAVDLLLTLAGATPTRAASKAATPGTDMVAQGSRDLVAGPSKPTGGALVPSNTNIVPNNLPTTVSEKGLVKVVEGEIVDDPLALGRDRVQLGLDPLEGEFVDTTGRPRIEGTVAPRAEAIVPDGSPGGSPTPYRLDDEFLPPPAQALEESIELNTGASEKGRVTMNSRRKRAKVLRDYPHTGAPAYSPAQVLNGVAPGRAGPILSDAIKDGSGDIAAGLGATRSQIAEDTIAPTISGAPIRKGAGLLMSNIANSLSDAGANMFNLMHDSKLYTKSELEKVKDNIGGLLDDLVNDEVTLVNKSSPIVDEDTGRVSMHYVIGAGDNTSFATALEAKQFITRLPTERLDDFEVLQYSGRRNQYVPYKGDLTQRGEFLLRAKYTHRRASGAGKENTLKNKTAHPLTNQVSSSVSYIDRVSKGISRLDIRQSQANRIFKDILKPYEALKSVEAMDRVWDALKAAERNTDDFTPSQLSRRLEGNQDEVAAYRSVRRFYQAVYEVRNQQYRDLLSKKGYLTHKHSDGENGWVKPIKDSDKVVTVYWDEAGGIVDKQILLDKGIELDILEGFKSRRVTHEDGTIMETPYVAVRKGAVNLDPLPVQVLHNKRTYMGRHMDAKYVVQELESVKVNGKAEKVGRVVAVANNPVDAQKAAIGGNMRVRRAIETTETDASYLTQELNQMHDLQMLTNTKHRMDFEAMDVSRQEAIASPIESLDRVRNTMAKHVVLDEWIEYNTNKWIETYGHLVKQPGFSWGGKISLKADLEAFPEAKAQLAAARKVRERIQLTSGVHDLQLGEKFQQAMLGAGEWLSRASANAAKRGDAGLLRDMKVGAINTAARAASASATYNPVNKAKALAHLSFITANPIRQLIMQSTSATMYGGIEHGSKYFATGHAMRDFAFIALGKVYRDIDGDSLDYIIKQYSKASGVSAKEARKMLDDFEDSGTLGSVSSHQFLEHGFRSGGDYRNHAGTYATDEAPGLLGRTKHTTMGGAKTGLRALAHYGFEAGEKANRISAYLAVRNKHMVNGTIKDMDAQDLGVEGLRLAGDMGQYNKAAFQAGAIGLPFQFMSHTTRMIQYMTPNSKWTSWIASDVLSNQEKAKVGLWQAAMFGTGGLGLGTLFTDSAQQNGIDIDPLVHEALEEGLAGLALESLIEGMAGTDANINISGTMGPLSGITGDLQVLFADGDRAATPLVQAGKVLADLATALPVGYGDFTGASGGAISNVAGIVGNIDNIWMNPTLGIGEKLELQARHIAVMLPMVNNALQGRIMANTGEYMTKYGTPVAQVTIAEALSRGVLGVGPEQVKDTYALNAELRGRRITMEAPSHKELSTSGRDLANFTFNALRQLDNGQVSKQEVLDRIEASRAGTFMAYEDQTDRDILQAAHRKELIRLVGNKETLADELVKIMASDYELSEDIGWAKVITNIEKLGPSPYGTHVIEQIQRIQQNESGSKLMFEAEL